MDKKDNREGRLSLEGLDLDDALRAMLNASPVEQPKKRKPPEKSDKKKKPGPSK